MCFLIEELETVKLTLNAENIAGLTLSPGQREAFIWDTELAGFGVRLQGKRRTYVAQYRADGRTRRVTLGPVSRLMPDEARKAARKVLARATLGEDPQEEKAARRARAERTFAKVVEAYIFATSHLRPTSIRLTKLYLAGPYFR